jgi:predicted nucleotidyltransferase
MRTLDRAGLSKEERSAVEEAAMLLKSDLPVERVILFGSKARGTGTEDSDIDLLVLTSRPVTPLLRREVSDRLFEVNLRNDVLLCSTMVSEEDWSNGLIRHMLIHSEVERDGCEV